MLNRLVIQMNTSLCTRFRMEPQRPWQSRYRQRTMRNAGEYLVIDRTTLYRALTLPDRSRWVELGESPA